MNIGEFNNSNQTKCNNTYRLTNVPRRTGMSWRRDSGGEMESDRNRLWIESRGLRVVWLCAISLRANSLLASFQLFRVDGVAVVLVKLNKSSCRLKCMNSLVGKSGVDGFSAIEIDVAVDLGVEGALLKSPKRNGMALFGVFGVLSVSSVSIEPL